MCSLGFADLKTYLDMAYDNYVNGGNYRNFKATDHIGLQDDMSMVLNEKVWLHKHFWYAIEFIDYFYNLFHTQA